MRNKRDKRATVTQKPRVLIADDDKDFSESLAALFENEGFKVVCKAAVDPSIESICGEFFDVIVLDMHMPERGEREIRPDAGLLVTRLSRQYADVDKSVIIVVFTGYPRVKDCFAAIDTGAYYLPKNVIDADRGEVDMCMELVQTCQKLIDQRHKKKSSRPWLESHYSELMKRFPGQAVAVLDMDADTGDLKTTKIGEYKVFSAPTVKQLKKIILRDPRLREAMPLVLDIWKEEH
jgi:CheY-like chemotaxis protein